MSSSTLRSEFKPEKRRGTAPFIKSRYVFVPVLPVVTNPHSTTIVIIDLYQIPENQ